MSFAKLYRQLKGKRGTFVVEIKIGSLSKVVTQLVCAIVKRLLLSLLYNVAKKVVFWGTGLAYTYGACAETLI